MQKTPKKSSVVGSIDVYETGGGSGTQVDLVLPLMYQDLKKNRMPIRIPLHFFAGEGHSDAAYKFASDMGASSVELYECRIFGADECKK